ncbi:unnamed protein product [Prorocentrum cordatum]|uniref:Uncharacterized protein n=1 Tax=Prorocentrum cordatum TaxID=2364126 RepID=A0ABN9PX47_9DINO|nr:unnamed protein product [Polarella glacialis]
MPSPDGGDERGARPRRHTCACTPRPARHGDNDRIPWHRLPRTPEWQTLSKFLMRRARRRRRTGGRRQTAGSSEPVPEVQGGFDARGLRSRPRGPRSAKRSRPCSGGPAPRPSDCSRTRPAQRPHRPHGWPLAGLPQTVLLAAQAAPPRPGADHEALAACGRGRQLSLGPEAPPEAPPEVRSRARRRVAQP